MGLPAWMEDIQSRHGYQYLPTGRIPDRRGRGCHGRSLSFLDQLKGRYRRLVQCAVMRSLPCFTLVVLGAASCLALAWAVLEGGECVLKRSMCIEFDADWPEPGGQVTVRWGVSEKPPPRKGSGLETVNLFGA